MSLDVEKRERFTFFTLSKNERNRIIEKILDFLKNIGILFSLYFMDLLSQIDLLEI